MGPLRASPQYVLEEGSRNDWFQDATITLTALAAVVALAFFVVRRRADRKKIPAVNLSLFKDSVFTSRTLIGGVMFFMLMANTFLLPLFMQESLGFTATQAGLALMPRSLVMMVATMIVGARSLQQGLAAHLRRRGRAALRRDLRG